MADLSGGSVTAHIPLRDRAGTIRGWTLIDEADLSVVASRTWHLSSHGYAETDRHTRLHRLLCDPADGFVVDHINRDKLDNRRVNLRVVGQMQNCQNTGPRAGSVSRHRGVYFDRRRGTWYGQVKHRGQRYGTGVCRSEQEAADRVLALRVALFPDSPEALAYKSGRAA